MQEEVKSIMTNTEYNISKQLDKKLELEFLWHVDSYINDTERGSDREAVGTYAR